MIRPVAADGRIETGGAFTPIHRPRVVERIASAALQRIVLIIAPAGYGKSVALRQYLDTVPDALVRYDVREEHATLLGFVRGFADALLDVAPDARKTVSGAYEKSRASKTPGLDLAMWLHAHIKAFTGVVAIDDLHIAENDPEISKFLISLIERTKGRARWLIASRSSLDLPVGSWLAYGDMDLNVDEQDLRFTLEEARQTAKASRVAVREEELDDILGMTEGWPTALSFALRSSTRSVDLRNIAASTREMVYRYLAEQVYYALNDEERELLRFVGYLPQVDLEVLRWAGYTKAKAVIEALRDRVAFIYPDRPGVYRCHDLFRDFLQHQVELEGDDMARAMQHRVGAALEKANSIPAALQLYSQSHSFDDVVRLLADHGFALLDQGHADIVQTVCDSIPHDVRATQPVVLALRGMSAANAGRLDRADSLLERAIARSQDLTLKAKIAVSLALLRANQQSDIVSLLKSVNDALLSSDLRGEILSLIAVGHALAARRDEAERAMQTAEDLVGDVDADEVRAKILQRLGVAALNLEMPLPVVNDLLTRANALAGDKAMYGLSSRTLNFLANAAELYEDDTAKTVWYAQQSVTAAMKAGDRMSLQSALLQLIHIETRRGNVERLKALEQQFAASATTDAARMGYIMPARAAAASWEGRFDEACRLMAMVSASSYYDFDRALDSATYALYLVADGKRQRAIEVCSEVLDSVNGADFRYLHGKRLGEMARLICAMVEALAGRATKALRIIQQCRETEVPFVAALRDVAVATVRALKTPALSEELKESLEKLSGVGYFGLSRTIGAVYDRCSAEAEVEPTGTLTKAELDILRSLATGRSPKDIALEKGRSVYTIQAHIQNIIRKLGCSGRNEALTVARKNGLINFN